MSKDIRSYFQLKKPSKPKPIEDDDDVIPESPDVQIKKKKKESRKRRILDDDSDDEISKTKKKSSSSSKTKSKYELKEVKPADLFGGPVKRTEPLVQKKKNTETGIHSDEEFEKSLLELDSIDNIDYTNDQKDKSPTKLTENKSNSKKSNINSNDKNVSKTEKKIDKNTNNTKRLDCPEIKISDTDLPKPKPLKVNAESDYSRTVTKNTTDHNTTTKENRKALEEVKANNKRKFEEFVDTDSKDNSDNKKMKTKDNHVSDNTTDGDELKSDDDKDKKKHNKSLNDSALTDEERHERKRYSAALYQKYLNRSGPKHLGAKQIPEGLPGCLKDCSFLLTGVLDSFEREEITEAITKYGGTVKNAISKKVTHVLAGEDAGPAKMAKAQELGIKIINEDEFIELINKNSKKTNKVKIVKDEKTDRHESDKVKLEKDSKTQSHLHQKSRDKSNSNDRKSLNTNKVSNKSKNAEIKVEQKSENNINIHKNREKSKSPNKIKEKIVDQMSSTSKKVDINLDVNKVKDVKANEESTKSKDNQSPQASMWVEKYKPQNIKQIIGQTGDNSNVKKLINWLTKWYANRKLKLPKPSPWAKNDDGGFYKAVLLSGPPGVGKTTTVSLVCKELGFDMVEFNASDTRNKTLIKNQIGELLTTNSLSGYAKGDTRKQAITKKHVLVMDEVDGMAGNEDRGGLQELINLIKSTAVPIICMCNDRNSQKMRSLVNYCYDLRFSRPRVDQIKSAMMSICFKESVKIPPDALSQLIMSANQDVRQTLNLLSMWAIEPKLADAERLKKDAKVTKKDIKLGPWEAVRKVFSAEDHKTMSIHDKSDLFFYDYSLAPLFVQENYLQVQPHCPKQEVLQRFSMAADSISLGDLVDSRIRRNQAWSLLPLQAMYSSVLPGHALSGHVAGQIQFPGWLGKNSRASKMHRLCQEIHAHARLSTTGSKSSIFLDYATHLRNAILTPMIKRESEGISESLAVMECYHLLREDLDSLVELSLWPGQTNPMVLVNSKAKAAMTRSYNKNAPSLPYAPGAVKRAKPKADDDMEEDDEQQTEDEEKEDSDPENDAFIKKKTHKNTETSNSKEKPRTSKGKSANKDKSNKGKKK